MLAETLLTDLVHPESVFSCGANAMAETKRVSHRAYRLRGAECLCGPEKTYIQAMLWSPVSGLLVNTIVD